MIGEIFSASINKDNNVLEISFNLIGDDSDVIRTDFIDMEVASDYNFNIIPKSYAFLVIDEEFDDVDEVVEIDENEIINFLNAYYALNPENMPEAQ